MTRERSIGLILMASAFFADQICKALVLASPLLDAGSAIEIVPFLNIVLAKNTGVSFGMLSNQGIPWWVFAAFGLSVVAVLTAWLWKAESPAMAAGLGLIIGGALSNIVDRWRHGGVTDFIDFHVAGWHWPAFNGADAAITVGVGLILVATLWPGKAKERQTMADDKSFTPALGRHEWTGEYDRTIRIWTREKIWRRLLVELIAIKPGERLLDVGCGTGTLAIMLKQQRPEATIIGLDPDPEILNVAADKAHASNVEINWLEGFARDASRVAGAGSFDVVSSSLMFHQVPVEEKKAALLAMRGALKPGGRLCIADYSKQRTWVMRLLFRLTVQQIDGVANTQPNADGMLPRLIADAGFEHMREAAVVLTPTGSISLLSAASPLARA
jgi:lipoprotein signal peptidase